MNRDTTYNTDSIYDNYLSPEGGARQSQGASTLSAGTERLSGLAPPMPRAQNGRQTAYSMADTASVYTNASIPFERWSLEDGLEPVELRSPTSTQRPPDSPRLADLRSMGAPQSRTAPMHAQTPVTTSMSPQPVQYNRRHFSRPFRPEEPAVQEDEQQPSMFPLTTPKIMVGQHRFSASTPDAYGGASFSPALQNDSPRLSAYASDIAGEGVDSAHLRRRSQPVNEAFGDARSASPHSIAASDDLGRVLEKNAARESVYSDSSSLNEKREVDNTKREPHPRPFSMSNTYPFTTSQNGYGSHDIDGQKTLSHKPSSRFSEDEKGVRSMGSTNEYHSSTWNLFGRSPVASPMWRQSEDGRRNVAAPPKPAEKQRKKRRVLIWVVAGLILLALAGAGTGIGIWKHNSSADAAKSASAKGATDSATPGSTTDNGGSTITTSNDGDSADVVIPARDPNAVAGSGGAGGYNSLVAFGGSYADDGHVRTDDLSNTLKVAPYDGGRSTNGPIFQEYMASLVGPQDSQSAAVFNYAYAGSSVNNSITNATAPDFPAQIATYLGQRDNGNATVAATAHNKALITIWAGMDELVTIWQSAISSNPGDPQTSALANVQSMLATLSTTLRWLLPAQGATTAVPDFVLVTLPRGDLLPQTERLSRNNTGYINVFRNMTNAYNDGLTQVGDALKAANSGAAVNILDADGLFQSIYASPSTYNLTDVSDACRDQGCTDPENFMWYDGMNPSTTMHRLVARHLAAFILRSSST